MADDGWKDLPTIDLLREAQNGQTAARDELFARYADRVLGIVRARLGPKLRRNVESGDIQQEALIEALTSLDRFTSEDESSLIRWLAAIVQNRISARAKYYNAERRNSAAEVSIDGRGPEREPMDLPDRQGSHTMQIRQNEETLILEGCLHELPENYRELILLRDYAGASWEDIAKETGSKSPDAARMMHTRARTQLGKLLQSKGVG